MTKYIDIITKWIGFLVVVGGLPAVVIKYWDLFQRLPFTAEWLSVCLVFLIVVCIIWCVLRFTSIRFHPHETTVKEWSMTKPRVDVDQLKK